MIPLQEEVPDFTFMDHNSTKRKLSEFRGKTVVLYFYPKDDTPGCTKEACEFRDIYDDILEIGAVVIGVSPDQSKSHENFRDKYQLPFFLVSDPEHSIAEQYGVWGEKTNYGKIYMGILRSTFIIDAKGILVKSYPKVSPEGHATAVLTDLKGLM